MTRSYFVVQKTIMNESDAYFRDEIKIKMPLELESEEPVIHTVFLLSPHLTHYEIKRFTGEKVKTYYRVKKEVWKGTAEKSL